MASQPGRPVPGAGSHVDAEVVADRDSAAIIFLQQRPAALGVAKPDGENTLAIAVRSLSRAPEGGETWAVGLVLVVAVVMVLAPPVHRSLPASLLAVAAATAAAELGQLRVARIGALPSSLPSPAHRRVLHAVGALDRLANERHVFQDLDAAVHHARVHVGRREHQPSEPAAIL